MGNVASRDLAIGNEQPSRQQTTPGLLTRRDKEMGTVHAANLCAAA